MEVDLNVTVTLFCLWKTKKEVIFICLVKDLLSL